MSHPDPQFDPAEQRLMGVFHDLPFGAYLGVDALSSSGLNHLEEGVEIFDHRRRNPIEATDEMEFGTAMGVALTEPDQLDKRYVTVPDNLVGINKNTNEWKKWVASLGGRDILPSGVLECAQKALRKRIKLDSGEEIVLSDFIAACKSEVTAFWERDGIYCKGRADLLGPGNLLADIKTTTKEIHPSGFAKHVGDMNYHYQAAWYLDGFSRAMGLTQPLTKFMHIVVRVPKAKERKTGPVQVRAYCLPDAAIERAWMSIKPLMKLYSERKASGDWSDDIVTIQNVDLMPWDYAFDPEEETA